MDKLPSFKFFLCCREVGDMDDEQYARTIALLVKDDDFATNAFLALKKRLADVQEVRSAFMVDSIT